MTGALGPAECGDVHKLTDFTLTEPLRKDWERMHASKGGLEKFNDDKVGMLIHWGLYSLTSGEWKGKRLPGLGKWTMWHATIPRGEYPSGVGESV